VSKTIGFTKCQLNAEACDDGLKTVQKILQEMRTEECFVCQEQKG
jgi:hypothetical protein